MTDPASNLERQFLDFLFKQGYRLPDTAQNRPVADVPVQPDFYYERAGVPGVCVFVDGRDHDMAGQAARDQGVRDALRDRGYRVVVIRGDLPLGPQVGAHPDVFGTP